MTSGWGEGLGEGKKPGNLAEPPPEGASSSVGQVSHLTTGEAVIPDLDLHPVSYISYLGAEDHLFL